MSAKIVPAFLVAITWSLVAAAGEPTKAVGIHPGLEHFKRLAGEWTGKGSGAGKPPHELNVMYKITAGGSAVVETIAPDTDHEMISVIHLDGDDLLLTHYCVLGNQPHMKAAGRDQGDKIAFKFQHATNLKSEKAVHMHDATYSFLNNDTLRAEWTEYRDGKAAGVVIFELKRKK